MEYYAYLFMVIDNNWIKINNKHDRIEINEPEPFGIQYFLNLLILIKQKQIF